jgi:Mg-chelatase subunit ChlI
VWWVAVVLGLVVAGTIAVAAPRGGASAAPLTVHPSAETARAADAAAVLAGRIRSEVAAAERRELELERERIRRREAAARRERAQRRAAARRRQSRRRAAARSTAGPPARAQSAPAPAPAPAPARSAPPATAPAPSGSEFGL